MQGAAVIMQSIGNLVLLVVEDLRHEQRLILLITSWYLFTCSYGNAGKTERIIKKSREKSTYQ